MHHFPLPTTDVPGIASVAAGIGSAKAFSFGLLSLASAEGWYAAALAFPQRCSPDFPAPRAGQVLMVTSRCLRR